MLLAFPQHLCREMGETGDDNDEQYGDDDDADDSGGNDDCQSVYSLQL